MNQRTKNRAGFTLVETTVVACLIGLLAAIGIPNFVRTRTSTRTNVCISNLREIQTAIEQLASEERKAAGTTVEFSDISAYLKNSIVCPAGGTTFVDSYSITTVAATPLCRRVPSAHLLPESSIQVGAGHPKPQGGKGWGTSDS